MKNAITILGLVIVIITGIYLLIMPNMKQKALIEQQITVESLQAMYQVLSKAYDKAVRANGTVDKWRLQDGDNVGLTDKIKKYMSLVWGDEPGTNCVGVKDYTGMPCFFLDDPKCSLNRGKGKLANSCGHIRVNARDALLFEDKRGKNGKVMFDFIITKRGLLPNGTPEQTDITPCSKSNISEACTDWIITKGNMDY